MRTSPVLFAVVAATVAAVHGCSLPLEGLSVSGNSGGAGGERSVTSAGGALSTATVTSSTSTGALCEQDSDCSGETECKTPKCIEGVCGFETASHDATVCGDAAGPCFDESQCVDGNCETRPKPAGEKLDDPTGNCTDLVCDGSGKSMPLANVADPPMDNDTLDCVVPICNGTMADTKTLANGAGCGLNKRCLNGKCEDCASDNDCGGDFNACTAAVCNAGKCGQKNLSNGASCLVGGTCAGGGCCFTPICGGGNQCCAAFQHCDKQDKCTY